MEDSALLELFASRDERAISETEQKYGSFCRRFARRILENSEDTEECLNDVWLKAWNTIPPQQPESLAAYLTALTRSIALDRLRTSRRLRRGGGQTAALLDELAECIPAADSVEAEYDRRRFLDTLSKDARVIFVRRYWYMNSCKEIAEAYRMSESKVRVSLTRTRKKLKAFLEKEELL